MKLTINQFERGQLAIVSFGCGVMTTGLINMISTFGNSTLSEFPFWLQLALGFAIGLIGVCWFILLLLTLTMIIEDDFSFKVKGDLRDLRV